MHMTTEYRRTYKDLSGQTFGNLMALWPLGVEKGKSGEGMKWSCQCACGKVMVGSAMRLRRGDQTHCGCKEAENRTAGALRKLIRTGRVGGLTIDITQYKANARKRGIEWGLTDDQAGSLMKSRCAYCGSAPRKQSSAKKLNPVLRNGIDRVDNSLGYTVSNTVPCCDNCNMGKYKGTTEEFLAWVKRVYEYQKLGE